MFSEIKTAAMFVLGMLSLVLAWICIITNAVSISECKNFEVWIWPGNLLQPFFACTLAHCFDVLL